MSDETPKPTTWRDYLPPASVVKTVLLYLLTAALGVVAARYGFPPPPVFVEVVKEVPVVVGQPGADGAVDFGWTPPTPEQVAAAIDPEQTDQFRDTPAGKAVMGDEDVFLWKALTGMGPRGPPWVNQKDVGCCVGCGFAHGCDVLLAVQAARNPFSEWRKVSVEAIYAGSRNEIGGGQIRGDGSIGQWAAKYLTDYGAAEAKAYQTVDLTEFSPARAREMGRSGARLPADVVTAAKANPVKGTALVRSWDDVARALRQGYPVAVCSNVGFSGMTRDKDGFVRASGSWAHCMCFIAVRGGSRPGAFCLNSWGESAHGGPRWPADAPPNGFWVDSATVDRMVRQADSYALADAPGFPSRRLPDWFIHAQPARPFAVFAAHRVRPAPAGAGW